jgi:type IV pilus assembly protein PilE
MMQKNKGFTLIEVMIVAVIVVVLANVAYPVYVSHNERTYRNQALRELEQMRGRMEQHFSRHSQYTSIIVGVDGNGHGLGLANNLTMDSRYTLTVTSNDPNFVTYTITATPNNWVDNRCGSFTLTNTGVKEVSGDADGDSVDGDSVDGDDADGNADVADIDDIDACWR